MIIPIKLVTVKANGKRFIFIAVDGRKVRVMGEVRSVSGASAVHGPSKVFLADHVTITDAEHSEELLTSMLHETGSDTERAEANAQREAANAAIKYDKQLKREYKKFIEETTGYDRSKERILTPYACKYFRNAGYNVGIDCANLENSSLHVTAAEAIANDIKLTSFGFKVGNDIPIRVAAANEFHEGLLKALDEKVFKKKSIEKKAK